MTNNVRAALSDPAALLNTERLWSHLSAFSSTVRSSGSPEELEAFRYAQQFLDAQGLSTRLLTHRAYVSIPGRGRLLLGDEEIDCSPNAMGLPTPGTEGRLVEATAEADLSGKIALCHGLATPKAVKELRERGASGAVFINGEQRYEMVLSPVWGSPDDRNLRELPDIPVVSVARNDRPPLLEAARNGGSVRLETELDTSWRDLPLLEADLEAAKGDGSLVLFSGHIDAWHLGAMDNGGANATMLEVAAALAGVRSQLRRSIRFLFWSGHSHGRYAGSQWYADNRFEELHDQALIHINIDSVGAKGATVLGEAPSMAELHTLAADVIASEVDQPYSGNRMERAGDQSFFGHGVSSVFMGLSEQPKTAADVSSDGFASLFGGGRTGGFGWWWHTPEDTIDKLDPANLARDARVYLRLAWRCCSETVPPLQYSHTAAELSARLTQLQTAAGAMFDLSVAITRAGLLQRRLVQLEEAFAADPARADWRVLKALGHILVPLNYVAGPVHHHDPALAQPALPALAGTLELAGESDPDMLEHLLVRLTRERNYVQLALRSAIELAERTLAALQEETQNDARTV